MPLLLPFSFAARWIFAIASFSSSCIVPSRMERPILLPRSKGPTNRTSMPGTLAMASTWNHQPSALLRRSYYVRKYIVQCFSRLNLDDGQQGIVGLLQIFRLGLPSKSLHGKWRPETPDPNWRKFGRLHELLRVFHRLQQGYYNAMG